MPFDANMVLADDTLDWTFANLVTSNYGSPTSLTRNAGGFAVIDMKETAASGLVAVFIADEAGDATDDALTLVLEVSDAVDFTSGVQTLANFEVAGVTHGVILGNEVPVTVMRRFSTTKRYCRVDASCVSGDDFQTCWVLLSPYPFFNL